MRKLILLSIILSITFISSINAQVSFSTDKYKYYQVVPDTLDTAKNNYVLLKEVSQNSIFHINKNYTMFTHVTPGIQSAYYVQGQDEYNAEEGVWSANFISDAGNTYYYVFDVGNKQVRVVIQKDGDVFLIVYICKSVFVRTEN